MLVLGVYFIGNVDLAIYLYLLIGLYFLTLDVYGEFFAHILLESLESFF
jgi:hypothetical protein